MKLTTITFIMATATLATKAHALPTTPNPEAKVSELSVAQPPNYEDGFDARNVKVTEKSKADDDDCPFGFLCPEPPAVERLLDTTPISEAKVAATPTGDDGCAWWLWGLCPEPPATKRLGKKGLGDGDHPTLGMIFSEYCRQGKIPKLLCK